MRILRRLTLYLAAIASLSVSISLAALWVRSNHVTDELTILTSSGKWVLQSSAGVLRCYFTRMEAGNNWVWGSRVYWVNEPGNPIHHQQLEWHCIHTAQFPPSPGPQTLADRGGSLCYLFPIIAFAWMPLRVFILPGPMPRLPRWLFTASAAFSVVVCITVAVLWIPSYWHFYDYESGGGWNSFGVLVWDGRLGFRSTAVDRSQTPIDNPPYDWQMAGWGFALSSDRWQEHIFPPPIYFFAGYVPCWLVIPLSAITPFVWFRRWRHERMNRPSDSGLCRKCGYDLRATPNQCPECGTPVSPVNSEKPRKMN